MVVFLLESTSNAKDQDFGKVPPIGLFLVVILVVFFLFLFRYMDKHVKNINKKNFLDVEDKKEEENI